MEVEVKAPEVGPNADQLTALTRGRGPRRGNLEDLLKYWRPIMKKPGGFRRCVVILMDKPRFGGRPQRICAWLHHELTGKWPNEGKKKRGASSGKRRSRRVTRSVRRAARKAKSFNPSPNGVNVSALRLAIRESRDSNGILTQPINNRQNAVDFKAALFAKYSQEINFPGEVKEIDLDVEVKRVGIFGSSSRAGQALQAAGSIALPGDFSDFRSPVRSATWEALTPGVPSRPGTGVARRLVTGGRGARNKFRCPPGFEKGGTFTNSEFSTCGAQLLRIPNIGPGSLAPAAMRSLARLSRSADLVRSIGDLRKNRNAADIIRAAQIPVAPKKTSPTLVKKSTDYILERLQEGDEFPDRLVRRDGVILEPAVTLSAFSRLDEFDDMADGTYVVTAPSGMIGRNELPIFSTGLRDVVFNVPEAGAIRVVREGGEMSPEEREQLKIQTREAVDSVSNAEDPTALIREFADRSDGRFKVEFGTVESGSFKPVEDSRNQLIKVQAGDQVISVPVWVYETFLSRSAPRRAPNDPIFERVEGESGGSKSLNPFFFTDASRSKKNQSRYHDSIQRKVDRFTSLSNSAGFDTKASRRSFGASFFDPDVNRFRCPPGTRNGGMFTDQAGTDCGGRIDEQVITAFSKIFDAIQNVRTSKSPNAKRIQNNPGLDEEKKSTVVGLTSLVGKYSRWTREFVDDVSPVSVAGEMPTIDEIVLGRELGPEERSLLDGDGLAAYLTDLGIYLSDPDILEKASAEELRSIYDTLSDAATAEAARISINPPRTEDEKNISDDINYAIYSGVQRLGEVLGVRTLTRSRPAEETDPSLSVREIEGAPEVSVLSEVSEFTDTPDGMQALLSSVEFQRDGLLADITDIVGNSAGNPTSTHSEVEAYFSDLITFFGDNPEPDEIEERNLFAAYFELHAIVEAARGDDLSADFINDRLSRVKESYRNEVFFNARRIASGEIPDSGNISQQTFTQRQESRASQIIRDLVVDPDVPSELPVEAYSWRSALKTLRRRQKEKAERVISSRYPNGERPWETDGPVGDMSDADLKEWTQLALSHGHDFDVATSDDYTLRVTPILTDIRIDKVGGAKSVRANGDFRVTLLKKNPDGTETLLAVRDVNPDDSRTYRRLIKFDAKTGNVKSVENQFLFLSNPKITEADLLATVDEANLEDAMRAFSTFSKDGNAVGIQGYDIADQLNSHAFTFYAASSKSAVVEVYPGIDGHSVWGRRGFRQDPTYDPDTLVQLNDKMAKLVQAYDRDDGSPESIIAKALIKDDVRHARLERMVQPSLNGESAEMMPGHGDFMLALDGPNGEKNSVAFGYFMGDRIDSDSSGRLNISPYEVTPERRQQIIDEVGQEAFDVLTAKGSGAEQYLPVDVRLSYATAPVAHYDPSGMRLSSNPTDKLLKVDRAPDGSMNPVAEIRSALTPNGESFVRVENTSNLSLDDSVRLMRQGAPLSEIPDEHIGAAIMDDIGRGDESRFTPKLLPGNASSNEVIVLEDKLTGHRYGIKAYYDNAMGVGEVHSEVAGYQLGEVFGFDAPALRLIQPNRSTSSDNETPAVLIQFAQSFYSDAEGMSNTVPYADNMKQMRDTTSAFTVIQMLGLDVISANPDRNPGNIMLIGQDVYPIDHGLAFSQPEISRSINLGVPLPEETVIANMTDDELITTFAYKFANHGDARFANPYGTVFKKSTPEEISAGLDRLINTLRNNNRDDVRETIQDMAEELEATGKFPEQAAARRMLESLEMLDRLSEIDDDSATKLKDLLLKAVDYSSNTKLR